MFSKLKSLKSSLHLKHSKHSSKDMGMKDGMKDDMSMTNKEGMMMDDSSMAPMPPHKDSMMSSDMSASDMSSKDMSMDMSSPKDGMMKDKEMMMDADAGMAKNKDGMMSMEGNTMSNGDGMMMKDGMSDNNTMKHEEMKMEGGMKKNDMGMEKMDKDMGSMSMDKNMGMSKEMGMGMKDMASDMSNGMMKKPEPQVAIFGAGCFWGTENMFLKHYPPKEKKGIISTSVGFIDGVKDLTDPSGKATKGGGSAEACRIVFDPSIISYAELVEFFYRFHDPTMLNYQGNDKGKEYRSAIFTFSDEQAQIARQVSAEVQTKHFDPKGQKIVTRIESAGSWHESPAAHQQYLLRNPNGYHCYTHKLHW